MLFRAHMMRASEGACASRERYMENPMVMVRMVWIMDSSGDDVRALGSDSKPVHKRLWDGRRGVERLGQQDMTVLVGTRSGKEGLARFWHAMKIPALRR